MSTVLKFFLGLFLLTAAPEGVEAKERSSREEATVPAVIIGGGVGGETAAIYLGRANLKPLVIEGKSPGGALAQSEAVENWPGSLQISGAKLMESMHEQAEASGARFARAEVLSVDFSKRPFLIKVRSLDDDSISTIRAASCIIATGSTPNFLGISGEKEYWGKGVSNCAICDGSLYKGKKVGVVGGGDAAILEALYLSKIADEVLLFVRKDALKVTDQTRKEALLASTNIKVHFSTSVEKVLGNEEGLSKVALRQGQATSEVALDGLFLAIGSKPNTSLFKGALKLDSQGYIVLKEGQHTSVPGVYAIGDAVDPHYKQAISAAGDAARAALEVQEELSSVTIHTAPEVEKPLALKPQVIEITSIAQFEQALKESDTPVLVDFYATWCGPCNQLSPKLELAAQQLAGKVKFLKVNVDLATELTQNYKIRSMPTALLFDDQGELMDRKVGGDEISALLLDLENR